MSQQPELTSPTLAPNQDPAPGSENGFSPTSASDFHQTPPPQRIPPWLVNSELFLRVVLRIYLGLVILFAPWSGELLAHSPQLLFLFPWLRSLWEQNPLFLQFPTLGIYAANGAVRGMVSGLGLLNLWIAVYDALHPHGR
jgi:hypothetical protein